MTTALNKLITEGYAKEGFRDLSIMAGMGVTVARMAMAMCHATGCGVPRSQDHFRRILKDLVTEGYALAQLYLGASTLNGHPIDERLCIEDARDLVASAASKGLSKAINYLGVCYQKGLGFKIDLEKAFECYEKAARQFDSEALINLGFLCEKGSAYRAPDILRAFRCFKQAAELGSADGIYEYARCVEIGVCVDRNLDEALSLYWTAAGKHHAASYFAIGRLLEKHRYLTLDEVKDYWKEEKESSEDPSLAPGRLEFERRITPLSEVMKYYAMAADLGHPYAHFKLGNYYLNRGSDREHAIAALEMFRRGSEHGCLECRTTVADFIVEGIVVKRDPQKAFLMYLNLAMKGRARAQLALAKCYDEGTGTAPNPREAVRWYRMCMPMHRYPILEARLESCITRMNTETCASSRN